MAARATLGLQRAQAPRSGLCCLVAGLGGMDLLLTLAAQAPTAGMTLGCCGVLRNLAKAPRLRPMISCSPHLAGFLALARDADSDVGEMAVCVLGNLAGERSCRHHHILHCCCDVTGCHCIGWPRPLH